MYQIPSGILYDLLKVSFKIAVYVLSCEAYISIIRRICDNNSTAIFCAVKVD